MKEKLVALDAVSLVDTRKTLWKPLIEEFAKSHADYFYIPKAWGGRKQLESWCESHRSEMLEGSRILEVEDLYNQGCEIVISFEPVGVDVPKLDGVERWAAADSSPNRIKESIEKCYQGRINKILSGTLPMDLPDDLSDELVKYYENSFVYIPGIASARVGSPSGHKERIVFVYDSEKSDLLGRKTADSMHHLESCTVVDARDQEAVLKLCSVISDAKVCLCDGLDNEWCAFTRILAALHGASFKTLGGINFSQSTQLLLPLTDESKNEDLLKKRFANLLKVSEESLNNELRKVLEEEVKSWDLSYQLEKFEKSGGESSSFTEWLIESSVKRASEHDWWEAPDKFQDLIGSKPNAGAIRTRRRRFNLLKSYYACTHNDIRNALSLRMNDELKNYAKELCMYWPRADWLGHFTLCSKLFRGFLDACEQAVKELYPENEFYKGCYAVIAVGIIEGIIPDTKDEQEKEKYIKYASTLFKKDNECNRRLDALAVKEAKLHLIGQDAQGAVNVLKTLEDKVQGVALALDHFEGHWYDLCDTEKRKSTQPRARECLEFLKCSNDSVPSKCELEAYFLCYEDDLECLNQFKTKNQGGGFASLMAMNLWNRDEVDLAKEWLKRENVRNIESTNYLHYCGAIAAILGENDLAKTAYAKMYSQAPDYFVDKDTNHAKWFLQALAHKALGDEVKEERYLNYAKQLDSLHEQRWVQWIKVNPGQRTGIVTNFLEPKL